MKLLDLNYKNASDHLNYDDLFHETYDKSPDNVCLRLWECSEYAIILGKSNNKELEVNLNSLDNINTSIIKRSSGGGTVVLGPGCLCYSLFIPINYNDNFTNITKTNTTIKCS